MLPSSVFTLPAPCAPHALRGHPYAPPPLTWLSARGRRERVVEHDNAKTVIACPVPRRPLALARLHQDAEPFEVSPPASPRGSGRAKAPSLYAQRARVWSVAAAFHVPPAQSEPTAPWPSLYFRGGPATHRLSRALECSAGALWAGRAVPPAAASAWVELPVQHEGVSARQSHYFCSASGCSCALLPTQSSKREKQAHAAQAAHAAGRPVADDEAQVEAPRALCPRRSLTDGEASAPWSPEVTFLADAPPSPPEATADVAQLRQRLSARCLADGLPLFAACADPPRLAEVVRDSLNRLRCVPLAYQREATLYPPEHLRELALAFIDGGWPAVEARLAQLVALEPQAYEALLGQEA